MGVLELEGIRYCTTCRAVYHTDFARCPNDGGKLELTAGDPLIGTAVAHYEIEAYVGGGGMGRVYRCHHAHLQHKKFALKVLRGDLAATMSMRLRFTQEAESASRLLHPNVVSVTDFGRTDDGLLYLAMDFVAGDSLGQLISRGPMPAARVIAIARQLCLGLAHAHELGLVHRDLKPDNILVEGDVPRIVDFGLAIHSGPDAEAARLTTAGVAVGTPVYAAPEQIQDQDRVDHRADLFALGVTMFEMLAGKIPFDGGMLETLQANANATRPTIASRAPGVDVPKRLERLVHRLMAPARDDRPATTREVLDELAVIELELVTGVATVIPTSVVTEKIARPIAPRSRHTAVVAVAVIAIASAAIYAMTRRSDDAVEIARAPLPSPVPAPVAKVEPALVDATPPAPIAIVEPPPAPQPITRRHVKRAHARGSAIAEVSAHESKPVEVEAPPPDASPAKLAPEPTIAAEPKPIAHVEPKPAPAPKLATSAKLSLDALSVRGALTAAQIKRALDRVTPALRACYGPAVTRAGKSPSVALRVRFEIDETQLAHAIQVAASTGNDLPGLSTCVDHVLATLRTEAAPDVGTVDVTFVLQLVPEGA